ncbi:MAG: hypothetical protein Q7J64_00640, partial [Elusimicrobiota bacterium]|nr:hypothetical protein [Elusimicrobiota bacterium]
MAVFLAMAAGAQPRVSVRTPFGSVNAGWNAAFQPAAISRDGALNSRAYPGLMYNRNAPGMADILPKLSPVAVALEKAGVSPETFAAADQETQQRFLADALIQADGLVSAHARAVLRRIEDVKTEEGLNEALMELDSLRAFSGYLEGEQNSAMRERLLSARV